MGVTDVSEEQEEPATPMARLRNLACSAKILSGPAPPPATSQDACPAPPVLAANRDPHGVCRPRGDGAGPRLRGLPLAPRQRRPDRRHRRGREDAASGAL